MVRLLISELDKKDNFRYLKMFSSSSPIQCRSLGLHMSEKAECGDGQLFLRFDDDIDYKEKYLMLLHFGC